MVEKNLSPKICTYFELNQDEVKSSAFAKQQITINPVPMYYIDPASGEVVRETLVISSDGITHDVSAVSSFRKAVFSHLCH